MHHHRLHAPFFERLPKLLLLLLLPLWPAASFAGECGLETPDYVARRQITIGDASFRTDVSVAKDRMREEADIDGHRRVTLYEPDRTIVFDPDARKGTAVPAPPKSPPGTRQIDSVGPAGERIRVTEFQRDGKWIELSRATCRADGIMLHKEFVSVDPAGQERRGSIRQEQIALKPIPPSAFEVPKDLSIGTGPR